MRLTIIGNGRFGNYLARQIEAALGESPNVAGPETDPVTLAEGSGVGIFCVPIRNFEAAWEAWLPHWKPNTVLMDTCSVKCFPCKIMAQSPRRDLVMTGTHPLFGPQSAPNSCAGQRTAIIPVCGSNSVAKALWETTLKTIPISCTEAEHDIQMGTQLLNHFIGRAAERAGIQRVELSTKTHELFMDIVDIIRGNSQELFEDMNRFNPYAQGIREHFLKRAAEIHEELSR